MHKPRLFLLNLTSKKLISFQKFSSFHFSVSAKDYCKMKWNQAHLEAGNAWLLYQIWKASGGRWAQRKDLSVRDAPTGTGGQGSSMSLHSLAVKGRYKNNLEDNR